MRSHTEEHRAFMRPKFPVAFELFYAVFEGTVDDVQNRLTAGDDPNARSADNRTPITFALNHDRDLPKADLLFGAGARIDTWDDFRMQPIHWTAGHSSHEEPCCLMWLSDHGADVNASVGESKKDIQFHPVGWTPLHIAADRASLASVRLLLDRHANINAKSDDGSTVLHVAAKQTRVYKRLIRMLLDAGAEIDACDSTGKTPLHILAENSGRYRKTAIQLLLSRNARRDIRDASGSRPIDLVREDLPSTDEIRRLLKEPNGR